MLRSRVLGLLYVDKGRLWCVITVISLLHQPRFAGVQDLLVTAGDRVGVFLGHIGSKDVRQLPCTAASQLAMSWIRLATVAGLPLLVASAAISPHPASQHRGVWTAAPRRTPSTMVPDGPIAANGDMGVGIGNAGGGNQVRWSPCVA